MPKYRFDINVFNQEDFSLVVDLPTTSEGWDSLSPEKQEELLKAIWDKWLEENMKVQYVRVKK